MHGNASRHTTINVANVDTTSNYGLDDVSLQGSAAFVAPQHPLTPNAMDRHKMMAGLENKFGATSSNH